MLKKPKLKVLSAVVVLALLLNLFILMNPDKASAKKSMKDVACEFIGCPGGQKKCGSFTGNIEVPGFGGVTVTYYCYEPSI